MPTPILMPSLSPTMKEGHLVKWHKSVGDWIQAGDLLMDIETDKAIMEVESTQEGYLAHIVIPAPAESVPIGTPMAFLIQEGEEFSQEAPVAQVHPQPAVRSEGSECSEKPSLPSFSPPGSHELSSRVPISPLARKLAEKAGLSWKTLKGSGPRGRIIKQDVLKALTAPAPLPLSEFIPTPKMEAQEGERLTLTPMRKAIAQRLTLSKQTIPHFSLSLPCRMDALLALRQGMNGEEKTLTLNDFMVRACALALAHVPEMRTLWAETHLVRYPHADLAIAVSIEGGLITPIVPKAETLPLRLLAIEVRALIERARAGQLRSGEYQGGIFTLSNLGMEGIAHFQPIINPPHSGILAIGACQQAPVIEKGQLTIGHVMTATVAADHRVVDGQSAARFLKTFQQLVENPYRLVM